MKIWVKKEEQEKRTVSGNGDNGWRGRESVANGFEVERKINGTKRSTYKMNQSNRRYGERTWNRGNKDDRGLEGWPWLCFCTMNEGVLSSGVSVPAYKTARRQTGKISEGTRTSHFIRYLRIPLLDVNALCRERWLTSGPPTSVGCVFPAR